MDLEKLSVIVSVYKEDIDKALRNDLSQAEVNSTLKAISISMDNLIKQINDKRSAILEQSSKGNG